MDTPTIQERGSARSTDSGALTAHVAGGARGWARRFFGVIAERHTWLNALYLVLAFPLGLFYFVFLVTGTALGLGLAILWVGLLILLLVMAGWWLFALLERQLARYLLGMDVGPSPYTWGPDQRLLARLRSHLVHPATWRSLAFVALKFPLGIASLAVVAMVGGWTNALFFAPAWSLSTESTAGTHILGLRIDEWWEALPLMPVGVLLFFVGLHLINAVATLWRLLVGALLVETPAALPGQPLLPVAPAGAAATSTPPPVAATSTPPPDTFAGPHPQEPRHEVRQASPAPTDQEESR